LKRQLKYQMKYRSTGCFAACLPAVALLSCLPVAHGADVAQWEVFETSYESAKAYLKRAYRVEGWQSQLLAHHLGRAARGEGAHQRRSQDREGDETVIGTR
jgi:hypothetical protein